MKILTIHTPTTEEEKEKFIDAKKFSSNLNSIFNNSMIRFGSFPTVSSGSCLLASSNPDKSNFGIVTMTVGMLLLLLQSTLTSGKLEEIKNLYDKKYIDKNDENKNEFDKNINSINLSNYEFLAGISASAIGSYLSRSPNPNEVTYGIVAVGVGILLTLLSTVTTAKKINNLSELYFKNKGKRKEEPLSEKVLYNAGRSM